MCMSGWVLGRLTKDPRMGNLDICPEGESVAHALVKNAESGPQGLPAQGDSGAAWTRWSGSWLVLRLPVVESAEYWAIASAKVVLPCGRCSRDMHLHAGLTPRGFILEPDGEILLSDA